MLVPLMRISKETASTLDAKNKMRKISRPELITRLLIRFNRWVFKNFASTENLREMAVVGVIRRLFGL